MVFIMPIKKFIKNAKQLVAPQDYVIINCAGQSGSKLSNFTKAYPLKPLIPHEKLFRNPDGLSEIEKECLTVSANDKESMIMDYLMSIDFANAIISSLYYMIQNHGEFNLFFVFSNKAYKELGERFAKRIMAIVNNKYVKEVIHDEFIFLSKEVISKDGDHLEILSRVMSKNTLSQLDANLTSYNENVIKPSTRNTSEPVVEKDKKKKKKKDKSKKKQKTEKAVYVQSGND